MKITIIVVGKTDTGYLTEGVAEYIKRISRYLPIEVKVIPYQKRTRNLPVEQQIAKEGETIIAALNPIALAVTLDERGKEFTSINFAQWLERNMISGVKEVAFIIGGAYGISEAVKSKSQQSLSLSKFTFSHQLIRLIFAEQLYRALTIIKGEPYHHE